MHAILKTSTQAQPRKVGAFVNVLLVDSGVSGEELVRRRMELLRAKEPRAAKKPALAEPKRISQDEMFKNMLDSHIDLELRLGRKLSEESSDPEEQELVAWGKRQQASARRYKISNPHRHSLLVKAGIITHGGKKIHYLRAKADAAPCWLAIKEGYFAAWEKNRDAFYLHQGSEETNYRFPNRKNLSESKLAHWCHKIIRLHEMHLLPGEWEKVALDIIEFKKICDVIKQERSMAAQWDMLAQFASFIRAKRAIPKIGQRGQEAVLHGWMASMLSSLNPKNAEMQEIIENIKDLIEEADEKKP